MPGPDPLLHITTAAPWRVALAAGSLITASLRSEGFVHLSRPDQVALPADRLYVGRDDLLLLVLDPDRLGSEVRWEPGVPGDPESMRFPHLYGPLPVAAVTSVVPWRPGADGRFSEPVGLPHPTDVVARARAFERSLGERRAPILVPLAGGMGTRDLRVPASHEHNAVWLDGRPTATEVVEAGDLVLGDAPHRRVVLDDRPPADLGWEVDEERIMVLPASVAVEASVPGGTTVVSVTSEVMGGLWRPRWRASVPGIADAAVEDLVRREAFADAHLRVVDLAVLGPDGVALAGTQLRIDGATAAVEAVLCDPDARGRGLARALVTTAIVRARAAGCDLVWLLAVADDWPRHWYERIGFVDVGARWVAHRPTA